MSIDRKFALVAMVGIVTAGCSDDAVGPLAPDARRVSLSAAAVQAFERYVSVGTSITMGVESDGVLFRSQRNAWPAQVAAIAGVPFTAPEIASPGCYSPLMTPLIRQERLDGSHRTAPSTEDCAAVENAVPLPANNVGMDAILTLHSLTRTPEAALASGDKRAMAQYPLVLPPNTTQIGAMLMQRPTFISIELGANEVLATVLKTSGLVIPGVTFFPPEIWKGLYNTVLNATQSTGAKALLVSVPNVTSIISVRPGTELWADREAFASYYINVSQDCENTPNSIFVQHMVLNTMLAAATAKAGGAPMPTLSCADVPFTADNVLTPADIALLTAVIADMNAFISAQAAARGFALMDINKPLADVVSQRGPFSVRDLLQCHRPYGQYVSADGIHPTEHGQALLANAAVDAINARYALGLVPKSVTSLPASASCDIA